MINEKRLLERFLEYIQIDSESGGEGAFAGRLKEEFGKMGIAAAQDRAGEHAGNLFVSIPGTRSRSPCCLPPTWTRWCRAEEFAPKSRMV